MPRRTRCCAVIISMANPKKYLIRRARPMDTFPLVLLMKEYLFHLKPARQELNETDCILWLLGVINLGGAWVAIVDKKLVASIGCSVDFMPWNKQDRFVFDEWYYVRPQYRKGYGIAAELIKLAKEQANQAGLPFHFSMNSGTDEKIDRYISMQGFTYMGGNFIAMPSGGDNGQG